MTKTTYKTPRELRIEADARMKLIAQVNRNAAANRCIESLRGQLRAARIALAVETVALVAAMAYLARIAV